VSRWSARWKVVAAGLVVVVVGVLGFVAYGALGPTGTPRAQLVAWDRASQLGQVVGTLDGDAARVTTLLGEHKDVGTIHTVCAVLTNDAQSANGNLPTPNARLTGVLSQAFTLEYEAGVNCYAGGTSGTALLTKSAAERRAAHADLVRALGIVAQVTGRTPTTTTTTQPGGGGIFG
jgi:hypothetical protein